MKNMRKLASLLLALVMVFAMATTAFADGEGEGTTPTSGTIKITPPEGMPADAVTTYKIYKVFDAVGNGTNISYSVMDGKEGVPNGFSVDAQNNVTGPEELNEDAIAAIKAYVANDEPVKTVEATGSNPVTATGLADGYYYITTTTGSVVTIDSVNTTAEVTDKNTVPTLDKTITNANSVDEDGKKAMAQVGTVVEFEVKIVVGKGAKDYVFHDKMSEGLQYNEDAVVTGVTGALELENPHAGDTITIVFPEGMDEGTEITITYSATITDEALTEDPEQNTAYLKWGETYETEHKIVDVYNAQIAVDKKIGSTTGEPLEGAGFVLKNSDDEYYKLVDGVVTWVEDIASADEHVSGEDGKVAAFTGLANGTYYLVEKTVPAGYNAIADTEVIIAEHDYEMDNLSQEKIVVNNSGSELPSTGGMGTTLFYIVGGILVVAAVVLLVTKKRMTVAE